MSDNALERVRENARAGCELRASFFEENDTLVVETARALALALAQGGKILLCGNGGSAADAQHIAAEFVNRFKLERPPLPALALTTDTSVLTAIANDYGYDLIFSKQIQALGRPGDVLVAISTSGGSPNVLAAMHTARERDLRVVALTGRNGGEMGTCCDLHINVADKRTPLVQEVHIAVGHLLCELVDYFLFESVTELQPDRD